MRHNPYEKYKERESERIRENDNENKVTSVLRTLLVIMDQSAPSVCGVSINNKKVQRSN